MFRIIFLLQLWLLWRRLLYISVAIFVLKCAERRSATKAAAFQSEQWPKIINTDILTKIILCFLSPLFVCQDRMESFTNLTNLIGTRLSEKAYNAVVTLQFTISKNKYIYIYFCIFAFACFYNKHPNIQLNQTTLGWFLKITQHYFLSSNNRDPAAWTRATSRSPGHRHPPAVSPRPLFIDLCYECFMLDDDDDDIRVQSSIRGATRPRKRAARAGGEAGRTAQLVQ